MMKPRRSHRRIRALAGAVALGAGALLAETGCENMGKDPQADSVLDLFVPSTPDEAARWAIDPYDADKRQRGLLLLANAPFGGEPPYVALYEVASEDDDPTVRAVAVRAIALHGEPSHVPLVADRLRDGEPTVRREAARALQRLHNPVAIDALIRAADAREEKDIDTRVYATGALGQYADPRVVQALIGALNDRRLAVNNSALASLKTLTGEDFGFMARRWLEWVNASNNLFAGRTDYIYPVFHRDQTIVEMLVPFWGPPNETRGQSPVGMAAERTSDDSTVPRSGG